MEAPSLMRMTSPLLLSNRNLYLWLFIAFLFFFFFFFPQSALLLLCQIVLVMDILRNFVAAFSLLPEVDLNSLDRDIGGNLEEKTNRVLCT